MLKGTTDCRMRCTDRKSYIPPYIRSVTRRTPGIVLKRSLTPLCKGGCDCISGKRDFLLFYLLLEQEFSVCFIFNPVSLIKPWRFCWINSQCNVSVLLLLHGSQLTHLAVLLSNQAFGRKLVIRPSHQIVITN